MKKKNDQGADAAAVASAGSIASPELSHAGTSEIHAQCHDLVCSGDRRQPRGAKGVSCSCRPRDTVRAELEAVTVENRQLWAVLNALVAKADPCDCMHDDENCCAKVGEDCIVCALAVVGHVHSIAVAKH